MFKIINSRIIKNSGKFAEDFKLSKLMEQSIPILIGIFILFNPFPHTTAIKEICYYTSLIFTIILISTKKLQLDFKSPLMLPFGLFVFWALLSIFFAIDKKNSIHDFYAHLLRYIILYYILINFFNSKKSLIYLSWIVIISSCIFIIGGLFYNYYILGKDLSSRFGIFTQVSVNITGIISVFAFTLSLNNLFYEKHLHHKIISIIMLATLFIGLLMSQTRTSIVALFLSIFVLSFSNKKLGAVILSLLLIAFAIAPKNIKKQRFNINSEVFMKRLNISKRLNYISYEIIKDYPITGIGFGLQTYGKLDLEKYQKRLPKKYQEKKIIGDPHNMVMDVAVRLGVVGLVFFKMCWYVVKKGKRKFFKDWSRCLAACFIAVSVIGLFQPIFSHMPEVVICTIFSMITIIWRLNEESISKDVV